MITPEQEEQVFAKAKKSEERAARARRVRRRSYNQTFDVIRYLNLWWEEAFFKTPASGGLRWGDTNVHWTFGDIIPPLSFPFCIELKAWKDFLELEVLSRNWDNIHLTWFWFDQTFNDAKRASIAAGKPIAPLMIYKLVHRKKNCLVMQSSIFFRLSEELRSKFTWVEFHIPQGDPFVVMDFIKFLHTVDRKHFEEQILGIKSDPIFDSTPDLETLASAD